MKLSTRSAAILTSDKEQRRIDGRKIKLGGRDRVETGNALVDSVAETVGASYFLPSALHKNLEQILEKTKKGKPAEKLSKKKKKKANIDEVD